MDATTNNNMTKMPKVSEKTDSEIEIICNSEIHDCWVKDCIKKSRDTNTNIAFSWFLHRGAPPASMCVCQAFVVR